MNIFALFMVLMFSVTCSFCGFAMQPKIPSFSASVQSKAPLLLLFGAVATSCAAVYNFKKNNNLTNDEVDVLCLPSDTAVVFLDREVKTPTDKKENP